MDEQRPIILTVDDDNRNQRIIMGVLEDDYLVHFAYSGQSCLDNVLVYNPDLILLDIMMPGLDGFQICKQLKSQDETKDIPVIFVSGKDALDDRMRGFEVGADDYFVKPFDHDDLLLKIKKTLENAAEKEALSSSASQASSIAFKTMQENSNLGIVLRFLENSFAVTDYQSLVDNLFHAAGELGISCSAMIKTGEEDFFASDQGVMSQLEKSVLEEARNKGRFFDFRQYTIVNYDHISVLMKDMPLDDSEAYGVMRDNICYLLNGAEAAVKGMQTGVALQRHKDHLAETIAASSKVMDELRDAYHQLSIEAANIVEDFSEEVNQAIMYLALTEEQEQTMEAIAERGMRRNAELFSRGIGIDDKFGQLSRQLLEIDRD